MWRHGSKRRLTGDVQEAKTLQSLLHHPHGRRQSLQAGVRQVVSSDGKLDQAAEGDKTSPEIEHKVETEL